jgi:hypothetical protein
MLAYAGLFSVPWLYSNMSAAWQFVDTTLACLLLLSCLQTLLAMRAYAGLFSVPWLYSKLQQPGSMLTRRLPACLLLLLSADASGHACLRWPVQRPLALQHAVSSLAVC